MLLHLFAEITNGGSTPSTFLEQASHYRDISAIQNLPLGQKVGRSLETVKSVEK